MLPKQEEKKELLHYGNQFYLLINNAQLIKLDEPLPLPL